jgi:hypothetical protein
VREIAETILAYVVVGGVAAFFWFGFGKMLMGWTATRVWTGIFITGATLGQIGDRMSLTRPRSWVDTVPLPIVLLVGVPMGLAVIVGWDRLSDLSEDAAGVWHEMRWRICWIPPQYSPKPYRPGQRRTWRICR